MTRQNKLIVLIAYLLILAVSMLAYRSNRAKKVKLLRAELAKVSSDKNKAREAEAEVARMTRLIPEGADTPAFIEALYRCARESGLKQHEASTEAPKSQAGGRQSAGNSSLISKHQIKISAVGSYRGFAEYIRRIQNIERFNRITEFKLMPETDQLKGAFVLELYSLPVKNAK